MTYLTGMAAAAFAIFAIFFNGLSQANENYNKHAYKQKSKYYYSYNNHYKDKKYSQSKKSKKISVQLGQRPTYLIDGMDDSALKRRLQGCEQGPFYKTDFSIGHRGAPLQFPEHTQESYIAAARQGAGILECDVTFTKDGHLVCRHAECDLHTTTNIVATELNNKCTIPWNKNNPNPNEVKCCTSDLSLKEFKSLQGKMDASDHSATTATEYLGETANFRTGLYTRRGTLLSHKESIRLFTQLGVKFTPELKPGDPQRLIQVFGGNNANEAQRRYAQAMIDDYKAATIAPHHVWAQSFNPHDVLYWIENEPGFGKQAIYLDNRFDGQIDPAQGDPGTYVPTMQQIADKGVKIIAPPLYFLLRVTDDGRIVPSSYAMAAKKAGLDIVAWTFERSDLRNGSRTGTDSRGNPTATFYYRFDVNPNAQAIKKDSDMYKALDVLARDVKILGIFSDWPATVTYYANCMGLK